MRKLKISCIFAGVDSDELVLMTDETVPQSGNSNKGLKQSSSGSIKVQARKCLMLRLFDLMSVAKIAERYELTVTIVGYAKIANVY